MSIRIEGLWKSFEDRQGRTIAVCGIDLHVEEGEFFALLGPSGCGKTTLLRCISGLETPDKGEIHLSGRKVFSTSARLNVPSHLRHIGMVFQSYAIWPHMTVFDNVAFPLRRGQVKISQRKVREQVMQALSLMHLDHLSDRPAPFLSGGQQQRVALARAIVHEPEIVLLDEPLSNLDAKLREEMRLELKELFGRLKLTSLYVTHDQLEALAMSDRVGVMREGSIVEIGAPRVLFWRPSHLFTAEFLGEMNIFEGAVQDHASDLEGLRAIKTRAGILRARIQAPISRGADVLLGVRPVAVEFLEGTTSTLGNVLVGDLTALSYSGDSVDCVVETELGSIKCRMGPFASLREGQRVQLRLPPERCIVLDPSGGSSWRRES